MTKLVKICICQLRILTFKIRRMRIVAFILSVETYCTALGQLNNVTICYFLKSVKSVFILVQCNTSLSKNYVAHSYVTVVCVIGWIWEKKLVCLCSVAVCAYEISRRTMIFHEFAFDTTKPLKHSSNFESGENVRSSNMSNSNFVTSLVVCIIDIVRTPSS